MTKEILDEIRLLSARVRALETQITAAMENGTAAPADLDMNVYSSDSASRVGCTIVIHVNEADWELDVYAPGCPPVGRIGLISHYFPRKHGSAGVAVDALIEKGFDWRHAIPRMKKAEKDYSESLGSGVTV